MAGLYADFPSGSDGLYGDTGEANLLDGYYAETTGTLLTNDPDPAIGANGTVVSPGGISSSGILRRVLAAAHATIGIPLRLWLPVLPNEAAGGGRPIFAEWRDAGNNRIGYCYIDDIGRVAFVNGTAGNAAPDAVSDGPVVTPNAWWHIETKLVCSTVGAGSIEVRVNGVTKINLGGLTTSAATCAQICHVKGAVSTNISPQFYLKDIAPWDGSGAQANNFIGSCGVFYSRVISDITLGGWTLSSGVSGAALIGVVGPPNDANYIAADSTPPAAAEFNLEDLPPDLTSIKFIVPAVRGAKVDGGDGNLQLALSTNGVNYDTGPDTPITSAMTYWGNATSPFVSHINPATGNPWTPSEYNAGGRLLIDRTV